ncbi:MAG TPA: NADH-quinone oxidoreductase subunit C [Bryobacteraceae bacterium]|nr:NADH-quinone oxidoreductase subunit C [Bryobacteraceae bacterium]
MPVASTCAIRNGHSVPLADVPVLSFSAFRQAVLDSSGRIAAFFGRPAAAGNTRLTAVIAGPQESLHVVSTDVQDTFPSLTLELPQVHLFEREIAEQCGVRPEGHPWLKPVRFPAAPVGVMDFFRMNGEEVHEVAVGPVHAGVIEPGHFRFQCHGENVFHLEISLGYQHRGVERNLQGGPNKRTLHYMETLAGDTTIGHATAYCQAVEALAGAQVSPRAETLRAIALELERPANHAGDLGALANDVGYLPTASYCGRIRGDFLNLTALLCGNRFGRGLVRPGGVGFDIDDARVSLALERLEAALKDVTIAADLLWNSVSVMARFEQTGAITSEQCQELGLVGVAARACGFERDVRHEFPWGLYRAARISISTGSSGDVYARAYVRWLEIQASGAFVREQLQALTDGPVRVDVGPLAPERIAVSLIEGWRGEICHVAVTDASGRFAAYKVVDPSFHNWTGLALALRNQQISDFPLCNKSFNLSYCGFDL